MNLSQHKLTIALVLSGLVHGLFMFGSFNNELFIQSTETQSNSLQLELSKQVAATSRKPNEIVADETHKQILATQKKLSQQKKQIREEKNQAINEKAQADQFANSADDYDQKKQLSRPVKNPDALMQLVYQAISEHKRYPYMARRLGQQGKVTLNFVLHPDGLVTNVVVKESSRYSVLDRAAEEAVEAISPFAMAAQYLNYEKVFDIAVDFRLN